MECKNCLRVNQLAFQREESLKKRLQLMGEKIKELNGGNQQKRLSHLMDVAGNLRSALEFCLNKEVFPQGVCEADKETEAYTKAKLALAKWDGIKEKK